jgi:hypothetical protein
MAKAWTLLLFQLIVVSEAGESMVIERPCGLENPFIERGSWFIASDQNIESETINRIKN